MFNTIYLKIISFIISIVDLNNKKKIIKFLKKKIKKKPIVLIDVGAHKGETIKLFYKNFQIKKTFAFEANPEIFKILKKEFFHKKEFNQLSLYNHALGNKHEQKFFNVIKDSSSSTFNKINYKSNYYKRKVKYLSFFKKNFNLVEKKVLINIRPLKDYAEIFESNYIDILKIDTEGFELNILSGIKKNDLKKIKLIYLEHHYDLMIKKNYKFEDLKKFFDKNNFVLKFKIKMTLRKTFEYIYENQNFTA